MDVPLPHSRASRVRDDGALRSRAMTSGAAAPTSRGSEWWIPTVLILLSLVPALVGVLRLTQLAAGTQTAENARFFAQPLPVVLHILVVIPYAIVGAFQFAP